MPNVVSAMARLLLLLAASGIGAGCLSTLPTPGGVGHVPLERGHLEPLEGRYSCDRVRLYAPAFDSPRDGSPSRVGETHPVCWLLGLRLPDSLRGAAKRQVLELRVASPSRLDATLVIDSVVVDAATFSGQLRDPGYLVRSRWFVLPLFPLLFGGSHQLTGLGVTRGGNVLLTYHAYGGGGTLLMMADSHHWDAYLLPRASE